jgi:hypothetical protein
MAVRETVNTSLFLLEPFSLQMKLPATAAPRMTCRLLPAQFGVRPSISSASAAASMVNPGSEHFRQHNQIRHSGQRGQFFTELPEIGVNIFPEQGRIAPIEVRIFQKNLKTKVFKTV